MYSAFELNVNGTLSLITVRQEGLLGRVTIAVDGAVRHTSFCTSMASVEIGPVAVEVQVRRWGREHRVRARPSVPLRLVHSNLTSSTGRPRSSVTLWLTLMSVLALAALVLMLEAVYVGGAERITHEREKLPSRDALARDEPRPSLLSEASAAAPRVGGSAGGGSSSSSSSQGGGTVAAAASGERPVACVERFNASRRWPNVGIQHVAASAPRCDFGLDALLADPAPSVKVSGKGAEAMVTLVDTSGAKRKCAAIALFAQLVAAHGGQSVCGGRWPRAPPPPPSEPAAATAGATTPEPAFKVVDGYIEAAHAVLGYDAAREMGIAEAEALCARLPQCAGITYPTASLIGGSGGASSSGGGGGGGAGAAPSGGSGGGASGPAATAQRASVLLKTSSHWQAAPGWKAHIKQERPTQPLVPPVRRGWEGGEADRARVASSDARAALSASVAAAATHAPSAGARSVLMAECSGGWSDALHAYREALAQSGTPVTVLGLGCSPSKGANKAESGGAPSGGDEEEGSYRCDPRPALERAQVLYDAPHWFDVQLGVPLLRAHPFCTAWNGTDGSAPPRFAERLGRADSSSSPTTSMSAPTARGLLSLAAAAGASAAGGAVGGLGAAHAAEAAAHAPAGLSTSAHLPCRVRAKAADACDASHPHLEVQSERFPDRAGWHGDVCRERDEASSAWSCPRGCVGLPDAPFCAGADALGTGQAAAAVGTAAAGMPVVQPAPAVKKPKPAPPPPHDAHRGYRRILGAQLAAARTSFLVVPLFAAEQRALSAARAARLLPDSILQALLLTLPYADTDGATRLLGDVLRAAGVSEHSTTLVHVAADGAAALLRVDVDACARTVLLQSMTDPAHDGTAPRARCRASASVRVAARDAPRG